MKVLVLLALVAAASARPQFFPFHNQVVAVKSTDPTNFPVATYPNPNTYTIPKTIPNTFPATYTASYPNPNTYTIPNTFPSTYSTLPSTYNAFHNVYGVIPTTYNTGAYPFTFNPYPLNPIVNPTDQKERSKRSTDESKPEPLLPVAPVTTAIHYPTTYTIPNTFPTTYTIPKTIPNTFPTTYNIPNIYNYPGTTGYNFPIGVTNPAFVNPYTSALTYFRQINTQEEEAVSVEK